MKIKVLTFLLCVFGCKLGSSSNIDSLKKVIKSSTGEEKLRVLREISSHYIYVNTDSAFKYGRMGLELSKKSSSEYYKADFLINIGNTHLQTGDYPNALNYYIAAEKIFDVEKSDKGKAITFMNIGYIFELQNLPDQATVKYESALKFAKDADNKPIEAQIYGHMGALYYSQNNKTKALEYFSLSLKTNQEINNVPGIMESLNNTAVIYQELHRYEEALQNFRTDLKYAEKTGIKKDVIAVLHNIGLVYKDGKKYNEAVRYLDSSVVLGRNIRDFESLQEIYSSLSEVYKEQNNVERVFEYLKLSAEAKDSTIKQTRDKQFFEMNTKYDSEKKEAENKLLKTEGEKQRAVLFGIGIGLALVLLLAYFIYRNYKVQQKANVLLGQQNTEIKEQKHIIEEKQKEILDSIAYAKKLQEAILPPVNLMYSQLEKMFLYYQPKDIVAGDFYWMETVKLDKEEHILIAAADSTGHGVPGAMVSVVCSNALNRAVKEFKITEPGEILDKARELVLETFAKSERDVKDGMDISLASIPKVRKGNTTTIKWAGANNPIYIISDGVVRETKANKFPVGAYATEEKQEFTTHSIEVKKGDRIYLFSDGLVDQFGGPKGKKYKAKRFQQKIIESSDLIMEAQKEFLLLDLLAWQGSLDQVDDILVIGVEV
jgi:serine phosphatase RsbU (regulator of sigma subunit)